MSISGYILVRQYNIFLQGGVYHLRLFQFNPQPLVFENHLSHKLSYSFISQLLILSTNITH